MARTPESGCATLTRATFHAREKELISREQNLRCGFSSICTGLRCMLAENPQMLTLYLHQGGKVQENSPLDQFYGRLEKTVAMRNQSEI